MIAFHSLRTRLTFWYGVTLLAGLLVFAGWIWFAVNRYMADSADSRISQRVKGLTEAISSEADESINALREELREFALETPEGELSAVRGRSSRDLLKPAGISEDRLWNSPRGQIGDLKVGATRYRALRTQITVKGETYDLAVATSTAEARNFLAQLQLLLFGAIPILVLVAVFGGFWMSRRALAPVDALTRAARRISLDNLGQRLDVPKTGDELERLADTWNEMLSRLDDAVQRIRQFTADASHELRTPISVIRTTAELALRRDRDSADYRKALANIHQESEWMTQLAEDLLLLARADAGTTGPSEKLHNGTVAIDNLALVAAQQFAPMAEVRGIALHTRLQAQGVRVAADSNELHRLLTVLLDNAVQYTPPEGTIEIETSACDGHASIRVRNSGVGIQSQDLPHIFERFYRGDPARTRQNGAGLGLAIARSLAQANGAAIEVDSEPGKGAIFSVTFNTLR